MRIVTILQTITTVSWMTLSLASLPQFAVAADLEAGVKVFSSQCASCHGDVEGRKGLGPSLFGIVGRKAGFLPEFRYSDGIKTSGLIWDEANLDRYVADPKAVIPGTTMPYAGLKDDTKRKFLIEYLITLK